MAELNAFDGEPGALHGMVTDDIEKFAEQQLSTPRGAAALKDVIAKRDAYFGAIIKSRVAAAARADHEVATQVADALTEQIVGVKGAMRLFGAGQIAPSDLRSIAQKAHAELRRLSSLSAQFSENFEERERMAKTSSRDFERKHVNRFGDIFRQKLTRGGELPDPPPYKPFVNKDPSEVFLPTARALFDEIQKAADAVQKMEAAEKALEGGKEDMANRFPAMRTRK